jgi:hypothetical protein
MMAKKSTSLDERIQWLDQEIVRVSQKMDEFRGTDKYNQLGDQLDQLCYDLSVLEGEREHNYWMEQEEEDDSSFYEQ